MVGDPIRRRRAGRRDVGGRRPRHGGRGAVERGGPPVGCRGRRTRASASGRPSSSSPTRPDGTLVWVVATDRHDRRCGRCPARTVNLSASPFRRAGGSSGSNDHGLVLAGARRGVGVAVWDVWPRSPPGVLDPAGRYLASSVRRVVVARRRARGRPALIGGDGPHGDASPGHRRRRLLTRRRAPGPGGRLRRPGGCSSSSPSGSVDRGFVVPGVPHPTFGWTAEGDLDRTLAPA